MNGSTNTARAPDLRFEFGRNWQRYLPLVDDHRIAEAESSLREMLGVPELERRRFLDIGSGSGLYSLAARRLGATVHSFDVDPRSVAATRALKHRYRRDDDGWTITQGSVLDADFMSALGRFDVVYAWGVLHHTGAMRQAMDHAAAAIAPGGWLWLALYNDQGNASVRWEAVKRTYNRVPGPLRAAMVLAFGAYCELRHAASRLIRLRNPLRLRDASGSKAGMSKWHDLVDWVGGYPFEVSRPDEVLAFGRRNDLRPVALRTCGGGPGNNEYLFSASALAAPTLRCAERVTLVIGSLGCGGAERTVVNLAAALARTGRTVTVITVADSSHDFYTLDPRVRRMSLGRGTPQARLVSKVTRRLLSLLSLRRALRESKPDVVVSFIDLTNVLTLIAASRLHLSVVVAERVDPLQHDPGVLCRLLRRPLYRQAASLVVQTPAVAAWGARVVGPSRVSTIPNGLVVNAPAAVPAEPAGTGPLLLAIGRLERQKGFDLLLEAYARVSDTRREWRLVIAGEGSQRAALKQQAAALGLDDRVSFPGIVPEVGRWLARADAFVLASRYEGFPNVLLEAMAMGCAVVAYACPSGPSDIVRHEHDGLLVAPASVDALAAALGRVMDDPALRERLGGAAKTSIRRFDMSAVLPCWERMLEEAALRTNGRHDARRRVAPAHYESALPPQA